MTTIHDIAAKMSRQVKIYEWIYRISFGFTIISFISAFFIPLTILNILAEFTCFIIFLITTIYFIGKSSNLETDINVLVLYYIRH